MTASLLCAAIIAVWGAEIAPARACEAAAIIVEVSGSEDPILVAAIAIGESRLDPAATNGRTCGGCAPWSWPGTELRTGCSPPQGTRLASLSMPRSWPEHRREKPPPPFSFHT